MKLMSKYAHIIFVIRFLSNLHHAMKIYFIICYVQNISPLICISYYLLCLIWSAFAKDLYIS